MPSLEGRVALVTGGSRSVGRGIALGLGEAGSAIATGLCAPGGWREHVPGRRLLGIDIALGDPGRGAAMAAHSAAFPAPTTTSAASGIVAKTVHSTMMPASSDIELFPNPITNALSAVSSLARM